MDWIGNRKSIYTTLGASNHVVEERAEHDYYATDPKAIDALLNGGGEPANKIWEPACGEGHLSERLKQRGFDVYSTDLINRGYGTGGVDFLTCETKFDGDILTNPPYKYAQQFVEHGLELISDGSKVFMFLKLLFLEGKARRKLFDAGCLKTLYVSTSRIICAKNGDFDQVTSSAVAYAWYEFEKGFHGDPIIKWIN